MRRLTSLRLLPTSNLPLSTHISFSETTMRPNTSLHRHRSSAIGILALPQAPLLRIRRCCHHPTSNDPAVTPTLDADHPAHRQRHLPRRLGREHHHALAFTYATTSASTSPGVVGHDHSRRPRRPIWRPASPSRRLRWSMPLTLLAPGNSLGFTGDGYSRPGSGHIHRPDWLGGRVF